MAGPTLIVMVVGALAVAASQRATRAQRWVAHTLEISAGLTQVIGRLTDAETGQRGYIITGTEQYLDPYRNAATEVHRDLASLRRLTADNPVQQHRLDALDAVVARKFAELDSTVALRRTSGFAAALARVETNRGKVAMDDARRIVAAMAADERRLLADRTSIATNTRVMMLAIIIGGAIVAGAMAFLVNRALARYAAEEAAMTRELEARATQLQDQAAELEIQNTQLQEQATELEEQAAEQELQSTMLQEQATELEIQNATLQSQATELEHQSAELAHQTKEARSLAEQLAAERRFLRQVIDINPNFVFAKNREGRFTLVNEAVARAYGTSIENLIGKGDADFNSNPDEVAHFRRIDLEVMDSGEVRHIPEECITEASGAVRWLQTVKVPILDAGGRAEQLLGVSTDITDRKRMERALQAETDRVRMLQRVAASLASTLTADDAARVVASEGALAVGAQIGAVGILTRDRSAIDVITNAHATPTGCNASTSVTSSPGPRRRRFANTPGLPFSDVIASGEPMFVATRSEYERRFPALRETIAVTGLAATATLPLVVEDRIVGAIAFDFTSPREFDEADRALLMALCRQCAQALDRARLYEAEHEARAEAEEARTRAELARRRADEANMAKSAFLATMSHELRTPLNAIGGYAELLELGIRGPVTEAQYQDLTRIRRAGQYLLGLINDVLNFVQLESAQVRYSVREVSVNAALFDAAAMIEPQAQVKGVTFTCVPCAPALTVRADPDKVQQVLLNLLSNAVKFTPRGGEVTLSSTTNGAATRDGESSGLIPFVVRDTGPGIPGDKLEQIFEPFVQVGRELRNPVTGIGLGLAISRELARGMGGDLTAESSAGGGSTFTLTLPNTIGLE